MAIKVLHCHQNVSLISSGDKVHKILILTVATYFQRLEGLTGQTGSVIDGVLTCTYKQSTAAPSNQTQIKDLSTSRYLLVATGTSSNGEFLREAYLSLVII